MKRFLLFLGHSYPDGGWGDFVDSYETCDEARYVGQATLATDLCKHWFHIVDTSTSTVVETN